MRPSIHLRNDFKGMSCEYRRLMVNAGQIVAFLPLSANLSMQQRAFELLALNPDRTQ
jgi:hypothetical protein